MSGIGKPLNDLTGRTFGSWTVLERTRNSLRYNHTRYLCQCKCGRKFPVLAHKLVNGRSTQCRACATGKLDLDLPTIREMWKTDTQKEIAQKLECSRQTIQRKLAEEVESFI